MSSKRDDETAPPAFRRVTQTHAHDLVTVRHGHEQVDRVALERGAGRGKLLYLDAGSGLAGDMLVAALLDLGVPELAIRDGLSGIAISGYSLQVRTLLRSSIAATHFSVAVDAPQPSRSHAAIVRLIEDASTLTDGARSLALRAFQILAKAEAQVHACAIEDVHFHEVGAVDSIVDIVAAALAFDYLGADVICSPLPMGRGATLSAHGKIPLPAPATVLCLGGVPTYDAGIDGELVTPTGACLVKAVARSFGGWPTFSPERVGVSTGTKQWPDRPNLLRVILGAEELALKRSHGLHVVIECNVDDMSPEVAAFALSRALAAGALDAWTTPIGMKKGRAAQTLSVLCTHGNLDEIARLLLSETTSFGVRHYPVDRIERARQTVRVETVWGLIQVKIASGDGLDEHVAAEYEDCRRAAESHGVPIRKVFAAALAAFEIQRNQP